MLCCLKTICQIITFKKNRLISSDFLFITKSNWPILNYTSYYNQVGENMKGTKIIIISIVVCLLLAIAIFGFVAINQQEYNIKAELNYSTSDANVQVTTKIYEYGDYLNVTQRSPSKNAELASFYSNGHLEEVFNKSCEIENNSKDSTTQKLMLNQADKKAIYICVSIKNVGEKAAYSRVVGYSFKNLKSSSVVEFADTNLMKYMTSGQKIEIGETKDMIFALSTEDSTIDLQISSKVYRNDDLKYDQDNHYYYVEFGYTSYIDENNNTPLRWKLVSTDGGVTRYTAPDQDTVSTCHPSGDCVFVQETGIGRGQVFLDTSKYDEETGLHTDTENANRYANDYWSSDIRSALQLATNYGYTEQQSVAQDNLYSRIQKRSIYNLYDNIINNSVIYGDKPNTVKGKTESDTFWLLSIEELTTWFDDYSYSHATYYYGEYFLRTPGVNGSYLFTIDPEGIGECYAGNIFKTIRSAFMLLI